MTHNSNPLRGRPRFGGNLRPPKKKWKQLSEFGPDPRGTSPEFCSHMPGLHWYAPSYVPGVFPLKAHCKGCSRDIVRETVESGWELAPHREPPRLELTPICGIPARREP